MRKTVRAIGLLALWLLAAPLARAAEFQDVESASASAWGRTGLWHVADLAASACGSAHSGTHAFYFGRDAQCNYADGRVKDASLTSPLLAISGPAQATLSFWTRWEVESSNPSCFDQLWVEKSADGVSWSHLADVGPSADPAGGSQSVGMSSGSGLGGTPLWQFVSIDLSAYIGGSYYFRFRFLNGSAGLESGCGIPADASFDDFLGWYVDDIALGMAPAAVSVAKTVAPSFAAPGGSASYSITVHNWDSAAQDIQLWDTLPVGAVFASASDGGFESGGVAHWTLSALAAGADKTVTLNVNVDPSAAVPSDWLNTASASSSAPGPSFDSGAALLKVRADGLQLTKTVDHPFVASGSQVTFTILLSNYSASSFPQVDVKETYPAGFVEAGLSPAYSGPRSWKATALNPGETRSYTVWGSVNAAVNGEVLVNRATAYVSGGVKAVAEASVTVSKPIPLQLSVKGVYPQPAPDFKGTFRQGVSVYFECNRDLELKFDLFNILGEKVRSIAVNAHPGKNVVFWDLANLSGLSVASGVYLGRIWGSPETGMVAAWTRIAVSR
ncbi:MAG: hypothetical protein V4498_10455 [candidate division FCPU426 bacterium]